MEEAREQCTPDNLNIAKGLNPSSQTMRYTSMQCYIIPTRSQNLSSSQKSSFQTQCRLRSLKVSALEILSQMKVVWWIVVRNMNKTTWQGWWLWEVWQSEWWMNERAWGGSKSVRLHTHKSTQCTLYTWAGRTGAGGKARWRASEEEEADMIFVKKFTRPQFWKQEFYAKTRKSQH